MLPGLMLAGVVLCAAAAGRWGPIWVLPLAVASIGWLLVNQPMEGRVLFSVSNSHGLTSGDLAGLAGLVVAGVVLVLAWFSARRPH